MTFLQATRPFLSLRRPIIDRLERASRALLLPEDGTAIDFSRPAGEPALAAPTSVSWRVFKNPVALFIGGITAVILELAEPRVRSGVWNHSGFRANPVRRLRRTGLAAMVTVYGARSMAETMIEGVRRLHDRVRGTTPDGEAYWGNDPELLKWVHVTASFGFLRAYHTYVHPLAQPERDRYYAEGGHSAALYGAARSVASEAEAEALLQTMRPRLEPSPILFEFLDIMRTAKMLPPALRLAQPTLVRASISLTPSWTREILGLGDKLCLKPWQAVLVKQAGALADRIVLESSPAVQASRRVGLPPDFLYKA
jgi:uncharacterized protein (DUF2236 family)